MAGKGCPEAPHHLLVAEAQCRHLAKLAPIGPVLEHEAATLGRHFKTPFFEAVDEFAPRPALVVDALRKHSECIRIIRRDGFRKLPAADLRAASRIGTSDDTLDSCVG